MQAGVAVPLRIVGIPDEDTVTGSPGRHLPPLRPLDGRPVGGRLGTAETGGSRRHDATQSWPSIRARRRPRRCCSTSAGRVVDKASRDHRQIYPQPGWVEHDAEEIWQNVLAVLGELAGRACRQVTPPPAGLAITNQRETFLVFDRSNRPAAAQCDRLAVPPRRPDLPRSGGRRPRPHGPRKDRPQARHLFLGLEAQVAASASSPKSPDGWPTATRSWAPSTLI